MQQITIIYIVGIGILALLLALFQYIYKSKPSKLRWILTALRFVSVFSLLLLLLNPKFESATYYEEKPNLVIAVDNSESTDYLKQGDAASSLVNELINDSDINQKFDVTALSFGSEVNYIDSLSFDEKQSNISGFFKNYNELFKNSVAPVLLVTDGNQTLGKDYQYISKNNGQPIYPVILGDTTSFSDLRISQVNVNRYAYLKNRFPIEIITNYSGNENFGSVLRISSGNAVLFSQRLIFEPNKTSEIINTTLVANTVGVRTYKVELLPLDNEKNKINNYKNFAVEVIDQKTNIALVSETIHPDLGALKKSIESNEQRSVEILKPDEFLLSSKDYQIVFLYQPTSNFTSVYEKVNKQRYNTFTVAGASTNWNLVNENQDIFEQEITNQLEYYQPSLNTNYGTFIIDNIQFDNYPPLQSEFGSTSQNIGQNILLYKSINGIETGEALLSTFEDENQKHALLNGEGIWRWRSKCYIESDSFESFDNFIGKLIQYLSSNKRRNRLNVYHKSFYNQTDDIVLSAQFFNKNYEFDANANLQITYRNKETNQSNTLPLLLRNASYIVDLSSVSPGDYVFIIKSNDEPISASGNFKVLAYNIEQQFLNADVTKLKSIATNSNGKYYFIGKTDNVINDLLEDERFATIQKSKRSVIPLIDYKYLLGLIALALSLEWFIRKYNGLI